jgi:hypothetical protein
MTHPALDVSSAMVEYSSMLARGGGNCARTVAMLFATVASALGRSRRPRQPPAKQELPQALGKQNVPQPLGRFGIPWFGRVFRDFR